jgi:hypothetical protein
VSVNKEKVSEVHGVLVRDLLDWIKCNLRDMDLCAKSNWYPMKKYFVLDDQSEHRFADDIECADDWWQDQVRTVNQDCIHSTDNMQSRRGDVGVCVPIILYADKTTISSFNGHTFHPIIARMGNIWGSIRNTYDRGGGFLVGYIPEVSEPFTDSCAQENLL